KSTNNGRVMKSQTYIDFFPLADIADQTRKTKETKETQHFENTQNAQRSTGLPDTGLVVVVVVLVEDQVDIVERNRADQVEKEPGPDVASRDLLRVKDDLLRQVRIHDACKER